MREAATAKTEDVSVLVYGLTALWWAVVPRIEAEQAWGERNLIWPKATYWSLWGALFWSFGFSGVVVAIVGNIDIILGVVGAAVCWPVGWIIGWVTGKKMEKVNNAPFFAIRSVYTPPQKQIEGIVTGDAVLINDDDAMGTRTAEPFGHESLFATTTVTRIREVLGIKENSNQSMNGKKPHEETLTFQPAWSDSFVYHRNQMVDEREHRKGGVSKWQKLQYGSLGVIALCLVGMVFLAVAAFQDKQPIDRESTPTAAVEVTYRDTA